MRRPGDGDGPDIAAVIERYAQRRRLEEMRAAARLPGFLLAIGVTLVLVLLKWQCTAIERITADATIADGDLWLYASDVVPGDEIEAQVRLRGPATVEVTRVSVISEAWGGTDLVVDVADAWAGEPTFRFAIPTDAVPGRTVALAVDVDYTVGNDSSLLREGVPRHAHFRPTLTVHGRTASAARRAGKGLVALLVIGGVTAMTIVARRRWVGWPGRVAVTAVVPVAWIVVAILGGHALRVHGDNWWVACLALALAAVGLGVWWTRGDRFAGYQLIPMPVSGVPGEAYRADAPAAPPRPLGDLERAWRADGLAVQRKGRTVIVFEGPGVARVPIVAGEVVGGGAPLALRCDRPELVQRLARAAEGVLGEVRIVLVEDSPITATRRA